MKKPVKRILHVFGAMDIGGAELRTLDVHRELRGRGLSFDYLTLSGRPGVLEPDIVELGGRVIPMALGPDFPRRFVGLLREGRYDAVHSHVATFSGAILALASLAGAPQRIAHFRSDGDLHGASPRRRLQRSLMKTLIDRCATDIVGVSPGSLSHGYRGDWCSDPRAQVIVNGIDPLAAQEAALTGPDLRGQLGLSPTTPLLLHVGRPSPEKNRPRVVAIFEALRQRVPEAHLVLVGGEGPDAEPMAAAIDSARDPGRIHEVGAVRGALPFMFQADVMVNASLREGLPGVVLESAAVGTPMVASDVPGALFIAESLSSVQTLSLHEPDTVWAAALERSLGVRGDTLLRQERAQEFAQSEFALAQATRRYEALYGEGGDK